MIEKVALYGPVIASSGVFAARRANKGIDVMDEDPLFGTANLIIAGGQTVKGIKAAKDLAKLQSAADNVKAMQSAADNIKAVSDTTKGLTTSSKILKGIGNLLEPVSNHINPLICCASAIKVLGSDDKEDTFVREALGLGFMFGSEKATKLFIGMPDYKKGASGKMETVAREAHPFFKKQLAALDDFLAETALYKKVSNSTVHAALKGAIFVLASITGYKIGSKIAELLIGPEKDKSSNGTKYVTMNTTPVTNIAQAA